MKYNVIIEEHLIRNVEIEGKNKQEAINKVMDKYMKEEIILGSEDYESTHFDANRI